MAVMRWVRWAPLVLLLGGCTGENIDVRNPNTPSEGQQMAANTWAVNNIRDAAINNAILTQHTLFPYHFKTGLEALNGLGEQDLAVLAANYRARPGDLSVRRGDASEDLYNARLAAVTKRLQEGGVDVGRMKIVDAPAGGPGKPSERVVRILIESETKPLTLDIGSASPGGTSGGGGGGSDMSSQGGGMSSGSSEVQK
jgi:hypothetical protein